MRAALARPALLALLASGALLALPSAARAVPELISRDAPELPALEVTLEPCPAELRARPAYGYVICELRNPEPRRHRVELELSVLSRRWPGRGGRLQTGAPFAASQTVELAPGARARAILPIWLQEEGYGELRVQCDGTSWGSTYLRVEGRSRGGGPELEVLVAGQPAAQSARAWEWALADTIARAIGEPGGRRSRGSSPAPRVQFRAPAELPELWSELTAFDLVVADGSLGALPPRAQQLLADYAAGGGVLLVLEPELVGEGAVRELVRGEAAARGGGAGAAPPVPAATGGRHGLGRWAAVAAPIAELARREPPAQLAQLLEAASTPWFERLPAPLRTPVAVPGVGEVPVRLFVGLIVLFAALAGPVNFLYWRRRARPLVPLLLGPVAGLALTGAIALWGVLGEGVGIKAASMSVTWLDQRSHRAVQLASQTLFAGLSPGALRPAAGTCVLPAPEQSSPPRLHFELEAGRRLGGELVPARTERTLVTVSVAGARERLRFRRAGEGGWRLLGDPALRPAGGAGALVLRDLEGRWFVLGEGEQLEPLGETQAAEAVRALCGALATGFVQARAPLAARSRFQGEWLEAAPPGGAGPVLAAGPHRELLRGWLLGLLGESGELPPGTYLLRVEQPPALDRMGLEVEERLGVHLVAGRLGAEDFVE
ncbi:MAG: hypothetical protein KatS3mg102_0498 [Planctomycetota bacterium]|nr:MAG: hypothetical protein KatS3mg102_0498 [Planctomycetota bacterium]